ncbi:MAG: ParB N-terminal domain-containing protein [Treponema sp.]|nr:ParB N-terminal domain-containing protein [Treponema sp.]
MQVQISEIKVKHRVRRDLGNLETLKDSLRRYGLLTPITLNGRYELVAGGRRLEAAKQLGWTSITANVVEPADEVAQLEMELEENTQRSDFTNADLLEGYQRLEKLKHPGVFRQIWKAIKEFFARIFHR